MALINRGAICLVKLDPVEGSEIGKTRPAVIVSNDINNEYADTVTIVPVTTSIEKIYPFEVMLRKNVSGLKEDSKVKANQIRTIDKKRIKKVVGRISEKLMDQIEEAIKIHLDMP